MTALDHPDPLDSPDPLHPLVNKTVELAFRGIRLRFDLSHALFSSFDIDAGTRLLLKAAARDPRLEAAGSVLDAGCGVGVLGLCVAAAFPHAHVALRDRDLLAAAFTARNRDLNGIPAERASVSGGLLADGAEGGPYGYILSNLPAKAGSEILGEFVRRCATGLLAPGGGLAFVIVATLAAAARDWCAQAGFAEWTEIPSGGHSVFVCARADAPLGTRAAAPAEAVAAAPGLALYRRSDASFELGTAHIRACGYRGLEEFDTVSYGTEAAIAAAAKCAAGSLVRHALFVEPGIGLSALWARRVFGPDRITIASRDLLALEASRANLSADGLDGAALRSLSSLEFREIGDASCDLQIWRADETPRTDWAASMWSTIARVAKSGSSFVAVCSTGGAARFARRPPRGMRILGEKKKKGFVAVFGRRES